jgi:hypothetical protein
MVKEEIVTSDMFRVFTEDPVLKEVVSIVEDRCQLNRNMLETGFYSEGEELKVFSYDEIRFLQGELKGLRYLQLLLTRYEEFLKETEKSKEKENG